MPQTDTSELGPTADVTTVTPQLSARSSVEFEVPSATVQRTALDGMDPLEVLPALDTELGRLGSRWVVGWLEGPSPPPPRRPPTVFATRPEAVLNPLGDSTICPPCTINMVTGVVHTQLDGKLAPYGPVLMEITTNKANHVFTLGEVDQDRVIPMDGVDSIEVRITMDDGSSTVVQHSLVPPS